MKQLSALLLVALLAACLLGNMPSEPRAKEQCEKEIFLTFDDGPTDSVTPLVLDVLRREGVKATFFLIGRQIRGREHIVRRIAADGHAIGIHTYSHRYNEIYASPKALREDILHCRQAIRLALPHYTPRVYRFPGGSFGRADALRRTVKGCGLRAYDWNAATGDALHSGSPADVQLRNALQSAGTRTRVILLQHDGVGQRVTAECLPAIIAHFRAEGFVFKTLEEDR